MHTNRSSKTFAVAAAVAVVAVVAFAAFAAVSCGYGASRARLYASVAPVPTGAEAEPATSESYGHVVENTFVDPRERPLSTFAIDVDTASYANLRRFLRERQLPPPDAVRIEEMVNYFRWAYPPPPAGEPLAASSEVGPCPWAPRHRLVRIGLAARALPPGPAPRRNLTFLIDVSGSMGDPLKLPLLRRALGLLAERLDERDRVAIVVYAGASGVVLPPTAGSDRRRVTEALEGLEAGGSTNGGEGIELAYRLARESFVAGGVNRVVLATDGDFNVGITSQRDLLRLIEEQRRSGIGLTVLGFGMGNLKDATMEMLADKGNGNYAYIDSLAEARKVLVEEAAGTFVTVAHDVKVQVEVNPAAVASYRLLGYENRRLRDRDFDDDAADAGELGAGQTVTALYEVAPAARGRGDGDGERDGADDARLMTVRVRYKLDEAGVGRGARGEPQGRGEVRDFPVRDGGARLSATSNDFRFAAAVAAFGLTLRRSPHRGQATFAMASELAEGALPAGADPHRREMLALLDAARGL